INKPWATKLVNGVLRNFQRDTGKLNDLLSQHHAFQSNHPAWLDGMLRKNWPDQFDSLVAANNQHPPFSLRFNTRKMQRADYLQQLAELGIDAKPTAFSPYGIRLDRACDPRKLPGFAEGLVSVQDEAAQL